MMVFSRNPIKSLKDDTEKKTLIWTSHYAPGIIAPSPTNANELIGLSLPKLRGGSNLNTMNKPTHVSFLSSY